MFYSLRKKFLINKFISILFIFILSLSTSMAEDTNKDINFDKSIIDLILESTLQKPASQATNLERESAINELKNIFLISNLPRTIELSKNPNIKAQLELQQKIILFNAFANDFYKKNEPSDSQIKDFYKNQIANLSMIEYKARHILVSNLDEANLLITELQNGANFGELAKKNSIGPSAESGGDLGWFREQTMVKEFSDAVTQMENGKFTDTPIMTKFGWHVILREDSRNSAPPPLEAVRENVIQQLIQEKFQNFIDGLSL